MQFRFTLNNTIAGSHSIDEPDGWKNIKIKLERHPEYQSLIEVIDTPFFFYNVGQGKDGGREYLYAIEQAQGINATVTLLVELTEDGTTWDRVFFGNLDLSTLTDVMKGGKFYKFQCNIIQSDLWSMFQNRKSTSVNLNATTDLDGNAAVTTDKINLELLSQVIRQSFTASENITVVGFTIPDNSNLQFAWDNIVLDEILNRFTIPISDTSDPAPSFNFQYAGTYRFQIVMTALKEFDPFGVDGMTNLSTDGLLFKIRHTSNSVVTDYTATRTDHANASATAGYSKFTIDVTITAKANDDLAFFFQTTTTPFDPSDITPTGRVLIILGDNNPASGDARIRDIHDTSTIIVTSNNIYPQTQTDAILIHDAANAIVNRITGTEIYSEYLGGLFQGYVANGCAAFYALMLGLHVRGYTFIEKLFAMNFDDFWSGANPILNLGLGVEEFAGVERIRIEKKDHFFNDTPSVYFDNVEGIERSYDQDKIIKSVKNGYSEWSAESGSGIDDAQTVHSRATIYKTSGQDIPLLSTFFAAGLGIEQTRRNRAEKGKDWKLDNNVMIIAVDKSVTSSPDYFITEVGSPFSLIFGMLNGSSRYNIRITPYRNFVRWLNFLSAGFQKYLTSFFRFTTGEGNYITTIAANSDTCDTGTWSENQDIAPVATPNTLHEMRLLPKADLTWTNYKTIRANRDKCIAVKEDASYTKVHIKLLEYEIAAAKADVKGWIK